MVLAEGLTVIRHHGGQHVGRVNGNNLVKHSVNQDQGRAVRGHLTQDGDKVTALICGREGKDGFLALVQ